MTDDKLLERITSNASIMGGKPVVRGLRITVEQIVRWFVAGTGEKELLEQFPFLEPDDVRAALLYASRLTELARMSGEAVADAVRGDRLLTLESRGPSRIREVFAEMPEDAVDIQSDGSPQKREGL